MEVFFLAKNLKTFIAYSRFILNDSDIIDFHCNSLAPCHVQSNSDHFPISKTPLSVCVMICKGSKYFYFKLPIVLIKSTLALFQFVYFL